MIGGPHWRWTRRIGATPKGSNSTDQGKGRLAEPARRPGERRPGQHANPEGVARLFRHLPRSAMALVAIMVLQEFFHAGPHDTDDGVGRLLAEVGV